MAEKITGTVLCCLEEDLKKKNIPFSATLVYLIYLVIYNSGKKNSDFSGTSWVYTYFNQIFTKNNFSGTGTMTFCVGKLHKKSFPSYVFRNLKSWQQVDFALLRKF